MTLKVKEISSQVTIFPEDGTVQITMVAEDGTVHELAVPQAQLDNMAWNFLKATDAVRRAGAQSGKLHEIQADPAAYPAAFGHRIAPLPEARALAIDINLGQHGVHRFAVPETAVENLAGSLLHYRDELLAKLRPLS